MPSAAAAAALLSPVVIGAGVLLLQPAALNISRVESERVATKACVLREVVFMVVSKLLAAERNRIQGRAATESDAGLELAGVPEVRTGMKKSAGEGGLFRHEVTFSRHAVEAVQDVTAQGVEQGQAAAGLPDVAAGVGAGFAVVGPAGVPPVCWGEAGR